MALRPLTNERWGFSSNCFVCEPTNAAGLGIAFSHDEEAAVVRADFTLDDRYSGAPSYLHGGLTMAVLDEAMAWAAIAVGGRFAVTSEHTTRFLHPVKVGRRYAVEARLDETGDSTMRASATVADDQGRPCAEASASFVVLSAAQAVDALGTEATGDDARYVR